MILFLATAYFWLWNDRLDETVLMRQLEDMRAHGLNEVCIHPMPKAFRPQSFRSRMEPDYLSDGFLDIYARVSRRAEELGMASYLYDEGGWPSGRANGLIARRDSEGRFRQWRIGLRESGRIDAWPLPYEKWGNPSLIEKGVGEAFIAETHDRYVRPLGDLLGKTVRIAFTDEPSHAATSTDGEKTLAWTSDFDEVFRRKKGYDLRPHVAEMILREHESDDRLARFWIDYRDVVADLFVERFLHPLRTWCGAHGMLSGGHLNGEDDLGMAKNGGFGDLLRSLRTMDAPGVDVIWRQLMPETPLRDGRILPFPRYASSAMHQNGGSVAISETGGIFGDSLTPEELKWLVDCQLVRGINKFVFGYYVQSNDGGWRLMLEPHAGPILPNWDYMPSFFRYVDRMCEVLSVGRPGAEIALFFDVRGLWAGGADAEMAVQGHYATARVLDRLNCDYDFVNDEGIATASVTEKGRLRVGAMEYAAVVLPTSKWMSDAARTKLEQFKRAGGTVAQGGDCSGVPSTVEVRGNGHQYVRAMKRILGNGEWLYFLFNESCWPLTLEISPHERGALARYDVESGRWCAIDGTSDSFAWSCAAFESAVFKVGGAAVGTDDAWSPRGEPMMLDEWKVRRTAVRENAEDDIRTEVLDEDFRPCRLGDWRGFFGECFCGEAEYTSEFRCEEDCVVEINLGKVCWCAGVEVNGRDLGKKFNPPHVWRTHAQKGSNRLTIKVANLLSALIGNEGVRREIWTRSPPIGGYEWKQSAFDKDNREGGLFGPVLIREVENKIKIPYS